MNDGSRFCVVRRRLLVVVIGNNDASDDDDDFTAAAAAVGLFLRTRTLTSLLFTLLIVACLAQILFHSLYTQILQPIAILSSHSFNNHTLLFLVVVVFVFYQSRRLGFFLVSRMKK